MDLFSIDLSRADRKPLTLVSSGPMELGGEVSPNGRRLAYQSNESGEYQIYVRPFPNVQDGRHQISTVGGTRAAWSRRGDELFYLDARGLLTVVKVTAAPNTFSAGVPSKLLDTAYYFGASALGLTLRSYDVAADAQRFLMINDTDKTETPATGPGMIIVMRWTEELAPRLTTG